MAVSFVQHRSGEFVMLTGPVYFLWKVLDGQTNVQIHILKPIL